MWWGTATNQTATTSTWRFSSLSNTFCQPTTLTQTVTASTTATCYVDWISQTGTASAYYNAQQLMLNRVLTQQQIWQERNERQLHAIQAQQAAITAPAVHRARTNPAALRARELLLSLLSDDQRRTYEQHGWFIVVGGRSGRRYRISGASYAGNVALLAANDNNKVEATYCGHCDHTIPLGDQLLAQKVMLEVDEPAYIALANRRAA